MGAFDWLEADKLFDTVSGYGRNYTFPALTDDLVRRAEETIGYTLPESYKDLLKIRNGGLISDELDESWISAIYGISPDPASIYGLEWGFDNWRNEWEYPDIGIPFGETQSAGHDMYYLDCRVRDDNGEPRVIRIDNEMDNEIFVVADNLVEFVRLLLRNEPLDEFATGEGGSRNYTPPVPKEKESWLKKLFR